jgi:biopolymer transport protein ExbB
MKPTLLVLAGVVSSVVLLALGNLLLLGQPQPPAVMVWPAVEPVCFWLGLFLWLLYACLVMLALRLALELRREEAAPPCLLESVRDAADRGGVAEARSLSRVNSSVLARVLAAGLARLPLGLDSAREAAYQMTLTIKSEKQRQLAYVELIGILGPTIGLVAFVFALRKFL